MTRKVKIPHSLLLKHRYAKTASALLERLPITRQFTASQSFLRQITPVWQQWCLNVAKKNKQHLGKCHLTAFEQGVLSISTNDATTATLIKHQIESLLASLHNKGFNDVRNIRVQIQLPVRAAASYPQFDDNASTANKVSNAGREKPDKTAISALQSAANDIDDAMLSESLARLAQTLKKSLRKD